MSVSEFVFQETKATCVVCGESKAASVCYRLVEGWMCAACDVAGRMWAARMARESAPVSGSVGSILGGQITLSAGETATLESDRGRWVVTSKKVPKAAIEPRRFEVPTGCIFVEAVPDDITPVVIGADGRPIVGNGIVHWANGMMNPVCGADLPADVCMDQGKVTCPECCKCIAGEFISARAHF